MLQSRRSLLDFAILAEAATLQPAAAATLKTSPVGSTLTWQYYAYGAPYGGSSTFTIQPTRTAVGTFGKYFTIYSNRDHISFNYAPAKHGAWSPSNLSLAPLVHNGLALNLVSKGRIVSVQVDPKTNMVGFDSSHIAYTDHQIQLDWQNLPFSGQTIVRLDVRIRQVGGAATPALPPEFHPESHPADATPP